MSSYAPSLTMMTFPPPISSAGVPSNLTRPGMLSSTRAAASERAAPTPMMAIRSE